VSAVATAVADLTREERRELWPRYAARRAGVSTAQARDAMLNLTAQGLLDLWYVVVSDTGDEVSRHRHPDRAPVGEQVTNFRADEPESFTVEDDDVYLMFSPTATLEQLSKVEVSDRPKPEGAAGDPPSAPIPQAPTADERAARVSAWSDGRINIEKLYIVHGDITGGDKVSGNKTTVGGSVIGDVTGGTKTAEPAVPQPNPKKGGASAVWAGLTLAVIVLVGFILLGILDVLDWSLALPAALGGSFVIAAADMIAAHLRR
jgi:hypothetical protein